MGSFDIFQAHFANHKGEKVKNAMHLNSYKTDLMLSANSYKINILQAQKANDLFLINTVITYPDSIDIVLNGAQIHPTSIHVLCDDTLQALYNVDALSKVTFRLKNRVSYNFVYSANGFKTEKISVLLEETDSLHVSIPDLIASYSVPVYTYKIQLAAVTEFAVFIQFVQMYGDIEYQKMDNGLTKCY